MVDNLKILDAVNAYNKMGGLSGSYKSEPTDFTKMVEDAISETKSDLDTAESAVAGSITGDVSVEELAIAVANAETSLKAIVAIRDKVVSAYQDIIRMPI